MIWRSGHLALARIEPQIKAVGVWLLSFVAGAGFGVLNFLAAIVIAGVLLAHSAASGRLAEALGRRLMGPRGADLVVLAERTIRGVATCGSGGAATGRPS